MSCRLPITAVASLCLTAGEQPEPLAPLVEAATGGQRFRRINRFIQLALIGAHRCRARDSASWPEHQPIVIATGQGNIADTSQMMEMVLGRGQPPMPFQFINLAGNMAGFYLAQSLGAVSVNSTVSQLDFPLEAALQVAAQEYQRVGSVLVGAVDELGWPLADHRRRLGCGPETVIGEGSHWFRIGGDAPALGWLEPAVYCHGDHALEDTLARTQPDRVVHMPSAPDNPGTDFPLHDTVAGAVLARFLDEARPGETLAHCASDGGERYAVVMAGRA